MILYGIYMYMYNLSIDMQWDQKKNLDLAEFGLQEVLCLVWEIKWRRVMANFYYLGTLYLLLSIHIQIIQNIISKTVIASPWHNKSIMSLNNQTKIQGPFARVKSTCIIQNTGCQIKQLCNQGTQFYVWNLECSGFGIHRVILYGIYYSKLHSHQPICSD